jgi:hypothetical protein
VRFEVREYQNGLINFSFPSSRLRSWLPTVALDSYTAKRRLSSWRSQGAIWFQLAKVRVTRSHKARHLDGMAVLGAVPMTSRFQKFLEHGTCLRNWSSRTARTYMQGRSCCGLRRNN